MTISGAPELTERELKTGLEALALQRELIDHLEALYKRVERLEKALPAGWLDFAESQGKQQ